MTAVPFRFAALTVVLAAFLLATADADAQRRRNRQAEPAPAVEEAASTTPTPAADALLSGMRFRSIGPAGMSGRVAAIDAVVPEGGTSAEAPRVIYVGAATGGLWKSTNGGTTFTPIFDDQPVASIGAVAVQQSSPDTVLGRHRGGQPAQLGQLRQGHVPQPPTAARPGSGKGLEKTERIHRVIVHPTDPSTLWVCAMGEAWGENPERGVFRTSDGGETWEQVLFVDERTGCADLVADPGNPGTLLAAMWQFRRFPHFFPLRRPSPRASTARATAATRGPVPANSTACRRATSVASAWPSHRVTAALPTPWWRRSRTFCCARRTAAAAGAR